MRFTIRTGPGKAESSEPSETSSATASVLDGALDTLGCVFRTMGDVSFPLDTAVVQSLNMRFILKQPFTLIMIDLDKFKAINDRYGHAAGDAVLRAVGDSLARSFTRKNDLIARYGGDEFAVILSDTSIEHCEALIERFIAYIREVTVPGAPDDVHPGCSVGFTEIAGDDSTETLVTRADRALYEAKAAGPNSFHYSPPP